MRLIFFGTPAFACPFLSALLEAENVEVAGVVTQPDKPVGRGGRVVAPAVKTLALSHDLPVWQPKSLKTDPEIQTILSDVDADAFVVVAYGKLIPSSILAIPRAGCINVHPSLLPRHRGPSPMQWAIAEGDTQTGVSIMLLDEGMDTGPILASTVIPLDGTQTYASLVEKVHAVGPSLLTDTLTQYLTGSIVPTAQIDSESTLTRLLTKEDGHLVWNRTVEELDRQFRAYQGWPGSWGIWERSAASDLRLKIHAMRIVPDVPHTSAGTVQVDADRLFVSARNGIIEILSIQPEGKPKMKASAFIQGYGSIDGAQLT